MWEFATKYFNKIISKGATNKNMIEITLVEENVAFEHQHRGSKGTVSSLEVYLAYLESYVSKVNTSMEEVDKSMGDLEGEHEAMQETMASIGDLVTQILKQEFSIMKDRILDCLCHKLNKELNSLRAYCKELQCNMAL